jgi:transcriptional regulator with XRE-family HTH domain
LDRLNVTDRLAAHMGPGARDNRPRHHEFALELERARREAGLRPKELASKLFVDQRTVRRYLNGERLPTIETTEAWERACNIEVGRLTRIHPTTPRGEPDTAARATLASVTEHAGAVEVARTGPVPRDGVDGRDAEKEIVPAPKPPRRSRGYLIGATIGLVLLAIAVLGARTWSDDPVMRPSGLVLRVDNRTTSGRYVREDPARLPLTTQPVPNCTRRGCVVENTPTWESKQQIDRAVCQQQGERITNGDDGSELDDDNPLLDTTRLYYGVMLTDGTTGYVAEVWIAREQRGGLGLPSCSTVLPRLRRG